MRSFVNYFVYFVFLRLVECGIVGVDGCKSGVPVHENEEFDPSEICVPAVTTPTKKCMPENFDALKIQKLVESHQSKHLLPLLCKSPQDNYKIGIGLVYIKSSYPEVALDHFTKLIVNRNDEICGTFYFMRALAFTKLGLDDPSNAQNAISDLTEALQAAEQKDRLKIYETRAQTHASINEHFYAYQDYTEAINILPSFRLYLLRAICLVFMEKYHDAYDDLQISLQMQPQQALALHYMATCLFHMRRYREALESYNAVLSLKPNDVDVLNSIALTHREMGNFHSAIEFLTKSSSINPTNPHTYQRKGELLYKRGKVPEALQAFKHCVSLSPINDVCQYMKGVCYSTMGQFYSAIKEITKGTTERVVVSTDGNYEYPRTTFLREFCRYIHSHLDNDQNEVDPDLDLNSSFRENWCKSTRNVLKNYTEQPGLQPHVKDIKVKDFRSLPVTTKRLLCQAHQLGRHLHGQGTYEDDGTIGNLRLFTASGLAAIEISQVVQEFWKSPKSFKNKYGERFTWRNAFDIAVKWIRLYRLEQPVFWVDTPTQFASPHIHRIAMLQNNETLYRHDSYLPLMLTELANEAFSSNEQITFNESNIVDQFYEVFFHVQSKWPSESDKENAYLLANSQHVSVKDPAQKSLDGYTLLLKLDNESKLMLMMDIQLTWAKNQQYHAELDFLWHKILEEKRKLTSDSETSKVPDSLIDLVITLGYYFINLMPVSSSTTTVAQSTTAGLLLALGKEIAGKAPNKKEIRMEALTSHDPQSYSSKIRSWLTLRKASSTLTHLENVSDRFSTYRRMLEVLQFDLSALCSH